MDARQERQNVSPPQSLFTACAAEARTWGGGGMDASPAEEQDGWQGGIILKHCCSLGYKPHVKNSL